MAELTVLDGNKLVQVNISFLKKLMLKLAGSVFVGYRRKPGWTAPLPFYVVKCKEHGYFIDYPHGHREYFICPKCLERRDS